MNVTALHIPTRTRTSISARINPCVEVQDDRRHYAIQVLTTGLAVAAVDVFSVTLAAVAATIGYTVFGGSPAASLSPVEWMIFAVGILVLFQCTGLYKPGIHPIYEVRQLLFSISAASVLAVTHLYVAGRAWQPMLYFMPIAVALVPVTRSLARSFLARQNWWGVRCLVFGANHRIDSLYKQHTKNATGGLIPTGFLQNRVPASCSREVARHFSGRPHRTSQVAARNGVFCALVHRCGRSDSDILKFMETHLRGFARVVILPDSACLPSLWSSGAVGHSIEDNLDKPAAQLVKRGFDIAISLAALVFGFPVLVALALWIKSTTPGPVFYGHLRIGKDGRRFRAWKFRSMVINADEVLQRHLDESPELRAEWEAKFKLQNDPRITSAGRFLRKTSLDELPQLWNVLVGEMSLVGPRPIVTEEIQRYRDSFRSYLRVSPGITGFWQVSGRNLTTYERRIELDEFYIRNWSVWFDLYVLCRTVKTVLLREGAF